LPERIQRVTFRCVKPTVNAAPIAEAANRQVSSMWNSRDSSLADARRSGSLEVHLLGIVDFDAALLLQRHLADEISGRNDRRGTLLLCEHPPLITVGREGSRADLHADSDELTARQIEVRWLNRGGGAIVHGPGQLAVYPILPLDRLCCGLVQYRDRMETAVAETCRELRAPAFRNDRDPGVRTRCGQFAFLGAAVKSWVSYHGMFINVAPRMDLMRMVRPAGNSRITSLAAQRLRPTSMHAVREAMIRHLADQFGYDQTHVYTGHPLLKRERRRVHVHA